MSDKNITDVWLLLGQMDSKLDRVVTDASAHEGRISKIERGRNYERGFIAAISAVVSFVISRGAA